MTISSIVIVILVLIQNYEINKQVKKQQENVNKKRVRFSDKVEVFRY